MEQKLNIVIMGQDCEKFLGMCLKSVIKADRIIYCDGGTTKDNSIELAKKYGAVVIENEYNQEDKGMNGKQRNFYLNYLKEHYSGEWALALDADEVVEDLNYLKEFVQLAEGSIHSIKMRHLIGDLGHEDATVKTHAVLHRLFYIDDAQGYPEVEHPVLQGKEVSNILVTGTTIWHLAYCPNMWDIKKRYFNHLKKSNMHSKEFLVQWRDAHLFGKFPRKEFNPVELPDVILNEFGILKDELYFKNRSIEAKHFLLARQWLDYFNPNSVLELGCGMGFYGKAIVDYNTYYKGLELSQWAVDNSPFRNEITLVQGNITEEHDFDDFSLVLAVDVLEHLEEEDLDNTLKIISKYGKNFLFSIPFIGDPNLDLDPTHKIKKSRAWWIEQLTKYFDIQETPEYFHFKHQILIGVNK